LRSVPVERSGRAVAQNLHNNPQILSVPPISPANPGPHDRTMGKIIIVRFSGSQLPRRLLNDGWWLESPPSRRPVVAFPKRGAPGPKPRVRHLTLVKSGK
jgi:hypothetical protein